MLVPGSFFFQPSQLFWVMPGAYPRVEHLKDASLEYNLALLTNIGLDWKNLPGINALAYYKHT
jgi:hypothetical protein